MKKIVMAEKAFKLYAEKFMTLDDIAAQLHVNERTLRRWKAAENWEQKKYNLVKNQTTFHKELFNFGRVLLKSIKNDMEHGIKVEPARMFTATKIFSLLKGAKAYEDSIAKDKKEILNNKPTGLTPDVIRDIEEKVLGITYNVPE